MQSPQSKDPPHESQSQVDGEASQRMRILLNETLANYPAHYLASQAILAELIHRQSGWRCYGAMETRLTFEGMEVTFDYRYNVDGDWRRFLIIVTMSNGALTYRDFKELQRGEHSGILAFEETPAA